MPRQFANRALVNKSDTVSPGSLKKDAIRSGGWLAATRIMGQIVQLGTTLVLARVLGTHEFGLMAMALLYQGVIDTFIDFGFLTALIQRKQLDEKTLSSCFWFLIGISCVICAGSIALSPQIANLLGDERVASATAVLALAFLAAPSQIVSKALLSRSLRLDAVGKSEFLSSLLRCGITIAMAMQGAGVWSLVYGYLSEKLFLAVQLPLRAGWRPSLSFDPASVREIVRFGVNVTGGSFMWYLYTHADGFIVGRVLGAGVLGVYTIASQFANSVFKLLAASYNRVAFPAYTKLQDAPDLNRVFIKSSVYLAVIAAPLYLGIAAVAPDLIHVLLGTKWADAALPMRVLAVGYAFQTISALLPALFNARGMPTINMYVNLASTAAFAGGLYASAVNWGLAGVLYVGVGLHAARYLLLLAMASRVLGLGILRYANAHVRVVLAAAGMCGVVIQSADLTGGLAAPARLAICVAIGAGCFPILLSLLDRPLAAEIFHTVMSARRRR
ncbi:MAG: lipopolysaccharide biosynthesis protein [Gammaproteobacteria bacterium]